MTEICEASRDVGPGKKSASSGDKDDASGQPRPAEQRPPLTLRGQWKPGSRSPGEFLGDGLIVLDGDRATLTGLERIDPPGWVTALRVLGVLLLLSGGGAPIGLLLFWWLRHHGKRPFDSVVSRATLRLDPLPPRQLRVRFVREGLPGTGTIQLERTSRGALERYLTQVGAPLGDLTRSVGPLRVKGRWHRYWRLRGELFGRARVELSDLGLVLEGRRTHLLRSLMYLAGLILGFLLVCVAVVALPVLGAWLANEAGKDPGEPAVAGLVLGGLLALASLPAWWIWRRVLVPPVKELIPWSLIEAVGAHRDGLWIRAQSSRGPVHGHLRKAPLSDLQGLEQAILKRSPETEKLTAQDVSGPLWVDRAILCGAAGLALVGALVLREAPPDWLERLQAAGEAHFEEDPDAARKQALDRVRIAVAEDLEADAGPTWRAPLSVDENATRLAARLRRALNAVPSDAPEGAPNVVIEVFAASLDYGQILEHKSFGRAAPEFVRVAERLDDVAPGAGNAFLVKLGAAYMARFEPSVEGIETRLQIAKHWIETGQRLDREACVLVGRFLVSRLAHAVEQAYRGESIDRATALGYGKRLEALGSNLDLPVSSLQKLRANLQAGNNQYIQQRVEMTLRALLSDAGSTTGRAARASYDMKLTPVGAKGRWEAGRLQRDGSSIGWIGIARDNGRFARAAWIPAQGRRLSVANVSRILGRRRPLVLTAGSYITGRGRTSGLAMAGGEVVNFATDGKMDGLVLFHRGRLSIHDMQRGVQLPGSSERLDLLSDLSDYQQFIAWAKDQRASCFQTHLLVANDALMIDPKKASGDLRERRLLATLSRGRERGMAIIDLPRRPRPTSLAEAGSIGLKALHDAGSGWEVEGLVNLDVGSFDILVSTTDSGVNRIGPLPPERAHNLVVIYE